MPELLNVLMRWLHIASVAVLVGGLTYGGFVLAPIAPALASETGEELGRRAAARFRPLVLSSICALVVSGLYNIFANPGHSLRYHILLGIKLLLVAHVFAVAMVVVTKDTPRRGRLMVSTAISGFLIVAISAYLRRIF
jgi:uncharacterized membrane protein